MIAKHLVVGVTIALLVGLPTTANAQYKAPIPPYRPPPVEVRPPNLPNPLENRIQVVPVPPPVVVQEPVVAAPPAPPAAPPTADSGGDDCDENNPYRRPDCPR